jgi:hypothetical protein
METLFQKIRELKNIVPDAAFFARSHDVISRAPQLKAVKAHLWESFRYGLALSLGSILLIIGLGGFSYLKLNKLSPFIIGGLNTKSLAAEADRANFDLELAQAQYFEDSSNAITVALNAVSGNSLDHLNDAVLEQELRRINSGGDDKDNIDALLNEI